MSEDKGYILPMIIIATIILVMIVLTFVAAISAHAQGLRIFTIPQGGTGTSTFESFYPLVGTSTRGYITASGTPTVSGLIATSTDIRFMALNSSGGTLCLQITAGGVVEAAGAGCGTGSGGDEAWDITTVGGTSYLAPTTTITTYHNNGFLSVASSTVSSKLNVTDTLDASSTALIGSNLFVYGNTVIGSGEDTSVGRFFINDIVNGAQIALDTSTSRGTTVDFYSQGTLIGRIGVAGVIQGSNGLGHLALGSASGQELRFYTNGNTNQRAVFTTGGNFGVATTSPGTRISTGGSILASLNIISDGEGIFASTTVKGNVFATGTINVQGTNGTSTIGTSLGVATTTTNSTFEVDGSVGYSGSINVNVGNNGMTLSGTTTKVYANVSGGAFTINFPTAALVRGREYTIIKTDSSANCVTLDPAGTEQISNQSTRQICRQNTAWEITSDGNNWYVQ